MMPKNTKKIILYLLRNLELVNINQISKLLDISVGSAFKILKELEKNNIVTVSSLGNAKFYQINLNSEETLRWCEILLSEERRNLKGYSKVYAGEIQKFEHAKLKEKLLNTVKKVTKRKKDWKSYIKELKHVRSNTVSDKKLLEGIFDILEQSESSFKTISESEEEKQERILEEKYRDAIERRGPLLRGIVGKMDGFDMYVYSRDHDPKHLHIIHKERGIDARFSFPQIEFIEYKGRSNTIGRREIDRIREYFRIAENFEKLSSEFQKQIS